MKPCKVTVVPKPKQTVKVTSTKKRNSKKVNDSMLSAEVDVLTELEEDYFHINNGGISIKIFKDKHNYPIVQFGLSNMGQEATISFTPHPVVLKQISDLFRKASKHEFEDPEYVYAARFNERGKLERELEKKLEKKKPQLKRDELSKEELQNNLEKYMEEKEKKEMELLSELGVQIES